jgi:hypothetical protein
MKDKEDVRKAVKVLKTVCKFRKHLGSANTAPGVYGLNGCLVRGDMLTADKADGSVGY